MHLVIAPPPSGAGFVRQRMVKSGSATVTNTPATVLGWASDMTDPAVVASDGMIISGAGTCSVSLNLVHNNWQPTVTTSILLNGNPVGSATSVANGFTNQLTTATVSGIVVADGDRLSLRCGTGVLHASSVESGGTVTVIPT